jgi:DNA polymerase-3 subunit alpha
VGTLVGKKGLLALVQAGACDSITSSRADAAALAEEKAAAGGVRQMSMFDADPTLDTRVAVEEWTTEDKLDREFDSLGFWLSGHPLDGFQRIGGRQPVTLVGALRGREDTPRQAHIAASVVDWDTKGTKSGGVMAILTLSDPFETFEAVAFDDNWFAIRDRVKKKATLTFVVSPMEDDGDLRLMVQGLAGDGLGARKRA